MKRPSIQLYPLPLELPVQHTVPESLKEWLTVVIWIKSHSKVHRSFALKNQTVCSLYYCLDFP